jgi:hypothetical protein
MFFNWLGTKTFVANTTLSGIASGYFFLIKQYPLVVLILLAWVFSLVTWREYVNALRND